MARKREGHSWMFGRRRRKGFPTLAVILLVLAGLWLLSELGILVINVPWIPIVLIIIAIGLIYDHYAG